MAEQSHRSHSKDTQEGQLLQKTICVLRTAKVVSGGRTFSFSVVVVVGDGQGNVGVGRGKASEVPEAMRKATETAKKNMIKVHLHKGTVTHDLEANFGATKVTIRPSPQGSGIIAGGPMRAIFEVMGVENISAKCFGSTRAMNVVHATFKALKSMVSPFQIAAKRGLPLSRILNQESNQEEVAHESV